MTADRISPSPKLAPLDLGQLASIPPETSTAEMRALLMHLVAIDRAIMNKDRAAVMTHTDAIRVEADRFRVPLLIIAAAVILGEDKKAAGVFVQWMDYVIVLAGDLRIPEMITLLLLLHDMHLVPRMDLYPGHSAAATLDALTAIAAEYPEILIKELEAARNPGGRAAGLTARLRLAKAGVDDAAAVDTEIRAFLSSFSGAKVAAKDRATAILALGDFVEALHRTAPGEFDADIQRLRADDIAGGMLQASDYTRKMAADMGLERIAARASIGIRYDAIEIFTEWLENEPLEESDFVRAMSAPEMNHTPVRATREPARNDPCPCGSGKKYKKCCGA